jgi:small subunit ribosomal protein S6
MRRYETIVIVDPDVPEDERNSLTDKIKDIISLKQGALIELEEWGVKRLAYEIRKKNRGHYFRIDYCGTGEVVDELERSFRINDRFLKFMTIMLAENADAEKIREEIAAAKSSSDKATSDDKSGESESLFDESVDSSFDMNEEEEEE